MASFSVSCFPAALLSHKSSHVYIWKEGSFSFPLIQARGSHWECTDLLGRFQMELVCLDIIGKLHWRWWRGRLIPFLLSTSPLTFFIVIVSPPTTPACSRPSSDSHFSDKDIKRTSQSVWTWTAAMWPFARAWFFPQQPLDYELESMCSISSPRCVHTIIFCIWYLGIVPW